MEINWYLMYGTKRYIILDLPIYEISLTCSLWSQRYYITWNVRYHSPAWIPPLHSVKPPLLIHHHPHPHRSPGWMGVGWTLVTAYPAGMMNETSPGAMSSQPFLSTCLATSSIPRTILRFSRSHSTGHCYCCDSELHPSASLVVCFAMKEDSRRWQRHLLVRDVEDLPPCYKCQIQSPQFPIFSVLLPHQSYPCFLWTDLKNWGWKQKKT